LSRSSSAPHVRPDIDRLARLNLWGIEKSGQESSFPSSKKTGIPRPKIHAEDLELKGIVRYPDGTFEGVFRDRKTRNVLVVREGETAGDLRILKIQPDRITALVKGKETTFLLFKKKPKTSPSRNVPASETSSGHSGGHHVVLPKKAVRVALGDMASFLRQVRIVPYLENGKPQGFQLFDIVPGSIVAQVGLKNGDVVERVNGRAIHTPQDAMQFFSTLQNGSGVTLEILRNHHPLTISVDLR
jgi:type II secretion system protein C